MGSSLALQQPHAIKNKLLPLSFKSKAAFTLFPSLFVFSYSLILPSLVASAVCFALFSFRHHSSFRPQNTHGSETELQDVCYSLVHRMLRRCVEDGERCNGDSVTGDRLR